MRKKQIPSYRKQSSRRGDRAFVSLNGRKHYLGEYDSPESKEYYERLVAEWVLNSRQAPVDFEDITIIELIARFWKFAQSYYLKPDGTLTSAVATYRQALRPLKELYGSMYVRDFGPMALKAVRQRMIDKGWTRKSINAMVSRVRRVFRWGVENELVPPDVFQALQAVSGLRCGRTEARESNPVKPVPVAQIEAIRPYVSRQIWAMVQLQLLTAARSGELVKIRAIDLNMNDKIWIYSPAEHKTAHHGHKRNIYIGPQAQKVIEPFLQNRPVDAYLFSPSEAEAERRSLLHKNRKTPIARGNRPGTNQKENPQLSPGGYYSRDSYRRAVRRACIKVGFAPWHPHQLVDGCTPQIRQVKLPKIEELLHRL